jgi:hypothetical protein
MKKFLRQLTLPLFSLLLVSFYFFACYKEQKIDAPFLTPKLVDEKEGVSMFRIDSLMYSGSKSDPTPRCLATTGLSPVDAENGVTVEGCCCLSFIGYQRLPFPPYQNVITYQQKRYSFNIDAGQAYRLRIPGSPLQMCSYTEDSYNYEGDPKQCDIH